MTILSSIARPYALAAFEYARDKQQLSAWKNFLEAAALVAKNASVEQLLDDPERLTSDIYKLFHEVLSSQLDAERNNFLLLLAQNKRLLALPEIAAQFTVLCAALEKISAVRVITAINAEEDFKLKLSQALTNRIKHDVTLHCETDPAIIGGAIIHIGDKVIDGSIRGKLTRLLEFSLR